MIDAVSGEPIRKANVTLAQIPIVMGIRPSGRSLTDDFYDPAQMPASRVANAPPIVLTTDEEGRFRATVSPGRHQIHADRSGYLPVPAGINYLSLLPGEKLMGVTLKLNQHAVIAGRVVDADGEPLSHARVHCLRWSILGQNGQRVLTQQSSTSTNDRGEYRLFGLTPGKYVVAADSGSSATFFAPGVTDLDAAAAVVLVPGATRRDVNIRMPQLNSVAVSGKVLGGQGNGIVSLMPRHPALMMAMTRQYAAPVDADGTFALQNVPQGQYVLNAAGTGPNQARLAARVNLEVGGQAVTGLSVSLQPGAVLRGVIRAEDAPPLTSVTLFFQPTSLGVSGGANSRWDRDGRFTVAPLDPGTYRVQAYGLPAGFYMKSIHLNGVEVSPHALELVAGPGEVVVTLAEGTAEVSGKIFEKGDKPASDIQLLVVNTRGESVRSATSLIDGQYRITGLPPGEYRVFPVVDADISDPDTFDRLTSSGRKITLGQFAREGLNLVLN